MCCLFPLGYVSDLLESVFPQVEEFVSAIHDGERNLSHEEHEWLMAHVGSSAKTNREISIAELKEKSGKAEREGGLEKARSQVLEAVDPSLKTADGKELSDSDVATATKSFDGVLAKGHALNRATHVRAAERALKCGEFASLPVRRTVLYAEFDDTLVVSITGFAAEQDDDLGFANGDRIVVTDKSQEWWRGYRLTHPDVTGMFPSNCVKPCLPEKGTEKRCSLEDFKKAVEVSSQFIFVVVCKQFGPLLRFVCCPRFLDRSPHVFLFGSRPSRIPIWDCIGQCAKACVCNASVSTSLSSGRVALQSSSLQHHFVSFF